MNQAAGNVFIKYNPYTVETIVCFDALDEDSGEEPKEDSRLHSSHLNGKRLQEWIDDLPSILKTSGREKLYTITFQGTTLDFEDVKAVSDASHIITNCEHKQGCDPEDKIIQLEQLFKDACALGLDNITDYGAEIDKAFDTGFEAYVVATMSAGKSTLINALLRQKLMPSMHEACTAVVTRICDTDDSKTFSARAYGKNDDEPRETVRELTYDTMKRLNCDENIKHILIEGKIPFVDAKGIPFVIVDTPGPNNSRNTDHRACTMSEIETGKQSLIVFLLDATQNGTDSEKLLLEDIAKAMKKGGKMSRDRFLFVVNKIDEFDDEPEAVVGLLAKNRDGLAKHGITDARIYPVSAAVALSASTGLDNASNKVKSNAETMIDMPELHLEQVIEGINSHIPASARLELARQLAEAEKKSDLDMQALIHSGIPSLEYALKEYIDKYARAMKIGEIADKLRTSLDCAKKISQIESVIMTDAKKRDEILAAIDILEKQIKSGEQGKIYEEQLENRIQSALADVESKIEKQDQVMFKSIRMYCDKHKEPKLSPREAGEISSDWEKYIRHAEDKLKNTLSDLLIQGIKVNAEQFLDEYSRSVEAMMPRDEIGTLPFDPLSLLGAEMTLDRTIDDFMAEEEKSRQVKIGTRKVKNDKRKGFLGFFNIFEPWYKDENVYGPEYYKEQYVLWADYAEQVIGQVRRDISTACEQAREQAKINTDKMFESFENKFKRLNKNLLKKTDDLRAKSEDDKTLKDRIAESKQRIEEIGQLQKRLSSILEI